jgi:uncharacterized surface protein with fasciclin (FAS1) repeats
MNYHIIKGTLASSALQNGQKLPTVSSKEIVIEVKDGTTYFVDMKAGKAKAITVDAVAANGTGSYNISRFVAPIVSIG